MKKEDKNAPLEEFENTEEEMYVTLELDDDVEVLCSIVTILTVKDNDYIVLQPLDENRDPDGDVWFYGYSEDPDDPNVEPELRNIMDDDEYEAVEEAFDEFLDGVEFDELIE